jgi:hypothetical protein
VGGKGGEDQKKLLMPKIKAATRIHEDLVILPHD